MLPEALSNRACSLIPHQDRLAVTVELEFEGAKVRRTAFHRSVIRSDARLDYPRVDRIFDGRERAEEPWATPLAAARRVADALAGARERRGALAVESVEPEFGFSRDGHVESLLPSEQTESHKLIEYLMIAANEAVAGLLESRQLAALYRVHEPPDPPRVERLLAQLESLDIPTPPAPDHLTPQQAGALVSEAAKLVPRRLTTLVLRSLKQAHYSPRNLGHFGLRSPRYCHFTSPIRRYPDLVCHRALLAAIGAGEDAAAGRRPGGGGHVVLAARARRDGDRADGRQRRTGVPARARAVRERLAPRVGRRGGRADRRGRVRGLRGLRGAAAGTAAARRMVGAQRARDDADRRRRAAGGSGSATRCG